MSKQAGADGAMEATTFFPAAIASPTAFLALWTSLAFCGQMRTQVPQTMQSSGTISAWPSLIRIALTLQLRTQR
jgi:hypothetical protein